MLRITAFLLLASLASTITAAPAENHIKDHFMITFDAAGTRDDLVSTLKELATVKHQYENFPVVHIEAKNINRVIAALPRSGYKLQPSKRMFVDEVVKQEAPASWGLDRVDQRSQDYDDAYSWESSWGGRGVHAYILDTGINVHHKDFNDGAYGQRAFITFGNTWDGPETDVCGHGTHVAGTVGGVYSGLAKYATLHAIKSLTASGWGGCSGSDADLLEAVDFIINDVKLKDRQNKAVVNMSFGGYSPSGNPSWAAALKALSENGIASAIAAGNSNDDACLYTPAQNSEISGVITVGATTKSDSRSYFSNYGSCVSLFAPGSQIVSAKAESNSSFVAFSGTSMAAPHTAGAIALLLSKGVLVSDVKAQLVADSTHGVLTGVDAKSPNLLLYTGI